MTNWQQIIDMVNETLSDEDKLRIAEGRELECQFTEDGIYPTPNDDAEFFAKYVNPVVVPNHEDRLARIVDKVHDWANHQREIQHTNQP